MMLLRLFWAWVAQLLFRKGVETATIKTATNSAMLRLLKNLLFGWPTRIALACFAALIAPAVFIIGMITLIGIPIAIIAMFVPAAAALYVGAELSYRVAFRRALSGRAAIAASLAVPIVAAFVVAQAANAEIDRRTALLVAGDRDKMTDAPIRRLALVDSRPVDERASACRELCLRLLLAGAVDEVLVARIDAAAQTLDPDLPALTIRFNKSGGGCRSKRIAGGDEQIDGTASPDAAERARLRVAAGECLEERPSRIAAADAVIVRAAPARGKRATDAGLDAFADTLRAERLSFFRRKGGVFEEEYRRTETWAERHLPLAMPGVIAEAGPRVGVAFWRITRRTNTDQRFPDHADASDFITNRLALGLSLAATPAPDRRALIDDYIAGAPADSVAARDVIDDFIAEIAVMDRRPPSRADAERLAEILRTATIELPWHAPSAAEAIARAHADLAPAAAEALFGRIETASPGTRQSRYNDLLISIAARALALLPDSTLAAEHSRIMRLLADKERRREAAALFSRLAAAGPDATGDLIAVVDAALEVRASDPDGAPWRDLYHAGLVGLCTVGAPEGRDALLSRLHGDSDLKRHFRPLTIRTLIASGAPPPQIRSLYEPGLDARGIRGLDADVKRAQLRERCDWL